MAIYQSKFTGQEVEAILDSVAGKQDKLTAGNGISIVGNTIQLNFSLYKIVTSLPSTDIDRNKIYLIRSTDSETQNIYKEYLYTDSGWEKLGEFVTPDDLSIYATKTELSTLENTVNTNTASISTLNNKVTTNTSNISTNTTNISNLSTKLSALTDDPDYEVLLVKKST